MGVKKTDLRYFDILLRCSTCNFALEKQLLNMMGILGMVRMRAAVFNGNEAQHIYFLAGFFHDFPIERVFAKGQPDLGNRFNLPGPFNSGVHVGSTRVFENKMVLMIVTKMQISMGPTA